MLLADKVLKQLGKEKAKDKYKVNKCSLCQIFVLSGTQSDWHTNLSVFVYFSNETFRSRTVNP